MPVTGLFCQRLLTSCNYGLQSMWDAAGTSLTANNRGNGSEYFFRLT